MQRSSETIYAITSILFLAIFETKIARQAFRRPFQPLDTNNPPKNKPTAVSRGRFFGFFIIKRRLKLFSDDVLSYHINIEGSGVT